LTGKNKFTEFLISKNLGEIKMGKVLLWEDKTQKYQQMTLPNKIKYLIKDIIADITAIFRESLFGALFFGSIFIILFPITIFFFIAYLLTVLTGYHLSHKDIKKAINDGYYLSIRQALVTEYPHGIVYILENVLSHLARYNLNYLPERYQHGWLVHGWPNQTKLKEALNMAKTLSAEWTKLNPVEQSQAMENIRSRIQTEDMYLGNKYERTNEGQIEYPGPNIEIKQEYYQFKIYKYYYDYEDYQAELHHDQLQEAIDNRNWQKAIFIVDKLLQLNPANAATIGWDNKAECQAYREKLVKLVSTNPPVNTDSVQPLESSPSKNSSSLSPNNQNTIINFSDWVKQNPALQHFSKAQQQKAYQKYLAEQGVKQQISFEEYVKQNPALEFFSPEEQQEAYQKYLQDNH
jgi:uncharacterized protein YneF (UPF0154 family)